MVSLSEFNQEVDEKFAPFDIDLTDTPGEDVVYLRNALRLTKNERHQLTELEAQMKAVDGDPEKALDLIKQVFILVGAGDDGKRLMDAMGDDPPKLMWMLRKYREATQPGEALPSES